MSKQHLAQLIWTGIVAAVLAFVALQQAADPGASAYTPESLLTGDPGLNSGLLLRTPAAQPSPWTPAATRRNVPGK